MEKGRNQISIGQLETYFKGISLPIQPFNLNPSHKIIDIDLFLESHFHLLRGKQLPLGVIDRPMYDRLIELKVLLESGYEFEK